MDIKTAEQVREEIAALNADDEMKLPKQVDDIILRIQHFMVANRRTDCKVAAGYCNFPEHMKKRGLLLLFQRLLELGYAIQEPNETEFYVECA